MKEDAKNIIKAIGNENELRNIVANMLDTHDFDKIMQTFDNVQKKVYHHEISNLYRILDIESQTKVYNNYYYSFFCFPVIADINEIGKMPSSKIAEVISKYSMPEDNIYLFDNWMDFDSFQSLSHVEYRHLLSDIIEKIHNKSGVCFLDMEDYSYKNCKNTVNSVLSWENGKVLSDIGAYMIMGIISHPYKEQKKHDGLYSILLGANNKDEDYFSIDREEIIDEIQKLLHKDNLVLSCQHPLSAIEEALWNLEIHATHMRINMAQSILGYKPYISLYHNETNNVLTLTIQDTHKKENVIDIIYLNMNKDDIDFYLETKISPNVSKYDFIDNEADVEELENFLLKSDMDFIYH